MHKENCLFTSSTAAKHSQMTPISKNFEKREVIEKEYTSTWERKKKTKYLSQKPVRFFQKLRIYISKST